MSASAGSRPWLIRRWEQWADLGGGKPGKAYMGSMEVRDSIVDAANRSIGQPGYAPARDPYLGYNMFAFVFTAAGLFQQAMRAFSQVHGIVTKSPWARLAGQPLDGFVRWRDIAGKNG
jgi:hypothetical protein